MTGKHSFSFVISQSTKSTTRTDRDLSLHPALSEGLFHGTRVQHGHLRMCSWSNDTVSERRLRPNEGRGWCPKLRRDLYGRYMYSEIYVK